jgi:hypothetical protein
MAQICNKTNKHFDSVTDIALDEMERQLAACAGHLPALFVYIFLDVVFGVKVKFFSQRLKVLPGCSGLF